MASLGFIERKGQIYWRFSSKWFHGLNSLASKSAGLRKPSVLSGEKEWYLLDNVKAYLSDREE